MFENKRMWRLCVTAGIFAGGIMLFHRNADADLFTQCAEKIGTLRGYDFETNRCGYIFSNQNNKWFSLPGGSTIFDQFSNDSMTNLCLYSGLACQGTSVFLPRGFSTTWPNAVHSVLWTTAGSCPSTC